MAWVLRTKPLNVKASRKLAERFDTMTPCPHDRPMKSQILDMLDRAIKEDQLRGMVWAEAYCKATGETYRINGKHTSHKLVQCNGDLKTWPFVTVEEYDCDTMEDVADLYCTFDPGRSARNSNDVNRIYLATNPELADVPGRIFSLAVTAVSYATWEDRYSTHDARERAQLALATPAFPVWLATIINSADAAKMLKRGPVAACMFRCWQKSQKAANEFWTAVRDGSDPAAVSPSRRLQKFLLITCGSNRSPGGKTRAMPREFYVRSIHAWNAWRRGETTDLKYFPAAKTPAVI
jgi:hypothetical protein